MSKAKNESEALNLRQQAEELLKKKPPRTASQLSEADTLKLIHELEVYQIELEMQNEELMLAKEQLAKAATDKYAELYDFAPSGYFTISREGTIIELNLNASQILGKERLYLRNKLFVSFISNDTKPIFNLFLQKIFDSKTKENCELTLSENGKVPVYVYLTGIVTEKGEQCLVTMVDITERKRTQEEFQVNEQKYRTLFNSNMDSISLFGIGPDGKPSDFIEFNDAACEIFGYTREELMLMKLEDFEAPVPEEVMMQRIETLQTKGSVEFETVIKNKKGNDRYAEVKVVLIGYQNQPALMNITRDITERKQTLDALKESEDKFRTVFYISPNAITLSRLSDNVIVSINNGFTDIMGYSEEDVVGKSSLQVNLWVDLADRSRMFEILNKTGKVEKFEAWFYTKKKELRFGLMSLIIIDIKGEKHALNITLDITERKQAEIKIQQSEALYSSILSASPSAITITDLEGRITFTSEKTYDLYGYDKLYDFTGHSILEYIDEQNHETVTMAIADMFKGFFPGSQDYKGIKPDGSLFDISVNGEFIRDAEGKPEKMIFITIDVTERKRLEEEKLKTDSRILTLSMAIEQSSVTTVITDLSGNIEFVNPKFTQTTGYTAEEAIGKNSRILKSGDKPDPKYKELWDTILSGQNWHGVFQNKKKNGELYWESAVISPVKNNEGVITHFLAVKEDITQRKQAEEEIKLRNEQLIQANTEKDKFFSIVAHDLRSPFNVFLNFTRMLVDDLPSMNPEQLHKFAELMNNSANNLFSLLENLLEWSRSQRHLISFDPASITLMPMITDNLRSLRESANTKGIDLRFDIPEDLMVFADKNMLGAVLRNLVTNAVKFTPKNGTVKVTAQQTSDNQVEISVKDTGIGMNKIILDDLFRLDSKANRKGTEGEPSTGLGLILCKEFVEKHGGRLLVESTEGQGSTFYFTIPKASDVESKTISQDIPSDMKGHKQATRLKVLIVEDDETSKMILAISLKRYVNEILDANTGIEAVNICRNTPDITIVFMDVKLPEMDGYEATRQIRQFNKDVIIIAQTAYGLDGDKEKAISSGCNDYILKPIDINDLKGLIRKHFPI